MLLLLSIFSYGQQLPGFLSSYAEASELSMKDGKILMIDFYTTWCKPCKKLDKEVYRNKEFLPYTAKMACIKVDAESESGSLLQEKFNIRSYPSVVFVDASGEEIERLTGYYDRKRYMKDVDRIILGKKTVQTMLLKFPDEISYSELFYLSTYYSRSNNQPAKKKLFYDALVDLDPGFARDSTILLTARNYRIQILMHDYSEMEKAVEFTLKYPKPAFQAVLADEIIRGYIYSQERDKAESYYSEFIKFFDANGDQQAIQYLEGMKKALKH